MPRIGGRRNWCRRLFCRLVGTVGLLGWILLCLLTRPWCPVTLASTTLFGSLLARPGALTVSRRASLLVCSLVGRLTRWVLVSARWRARLGVLIFTLMRTRALVLRLVMYLVRANGRLAEPLRVLRGSLLRPRCRRWYRLGRLRVVGRCSRIGRFRCLFVVW